MENENFNAADSIKTIDQALAQAKAERTGAQFYYIVWGTLLFLHFIIRYFLLRYPQSSSDLLDVATWAVFPVGGIISYFRSKRDDKIEKVVPLYEKIYAYAFGGFALAYGVTYFASVARPDLQGSFFSVLLGFTVFVTGGLTKHTPSLVGGTLAILLGGISLNVTPEIQCLLAAIASLSACLAPGMLMSNRNV